MFCLRSIFKGNVAIYPLWSHEYAALKYYLQITSFAAANAVFERNLLLAIIIFPLLILFGFWIRKKQMNARIIVTTFLLLAIAKGYVNLPASCQPEFNTQPASDGDAVDYETYFKQMRGPVSQYLKVMLDVVPLSDPENDDSSKVLESDHPDKLIVNIGAISAPPSVAELHNQLKESLNFVLTFMKNGGLAKVGFSKALKLAQRMQEISDQYHAEILKMITAKNLPKTLDPFLVQESVGGFNISRQTRAPRDLTVIDTNNKILDQTKLQRNKLESIREVASGNFYFNDYKYDRSSMLNGVGGAMGMSGLFNGLGGTGTNGLVDGLGFSSGLNGYVNGAGVSSGTSGMFNDINVMSPSSGSALHY